MSGSCRLSCARVVSYPLRYASGSAELAESLINERLQRTGQTVRPVFVYENEVVFGDSIYLAVHDKLRAMLSQLWLVCVQRVCWHNRKSFLVIIGRLQNPTASLSLLFRLPS